MRSEFCRHKNRNNLRHVLSCVQLLRNIRCKETGKGWVAFKFKLRLMCIDDSLLLIVIKSSDCKPTRCSSSPMIWLHKFILRCSFLLNWFCEVSIKTSGAVYRTMYVFKRRWKIKMLICFCTWCLLIILMGNTKFLSVFSFYLYFIVILFIWVSPKLCDLPSK